MYAPGDVRVEERVDPQIVEATDAIIRVSAACVCGSDLWPYRGVEQLQWPARWHGAASDRFMVHIAMQQNDETGSPVTWGEHVTDEQEAQPAAGSHAASTM
jgi:threonine dehydrogenase-like Zn-dependent dehydrogenase